MNYITKETFELQGFISFLNIIRCNKNYLLLHELKKWGDRMLTGMEVQRESGQSKGENSEVVRLKKKIKCTDRTFRKNTERKAIPQYFC